MGWCGSGNDRRMLAGSCHCGAVKVTLARKPRRLTCCNCSICGCIINWEAVDRSRRRMGVNLRNFDHELVASIRVRRLDGARTWKFLD